LQKSNTIDESPIVKELSNVASTAIHELEMTKQSLKEKELELKEIAEISTLKLNSAAQREILTHTERHTPTEIHTH